MGPTEQQNFNIPREDVVESMPVMGGGNKKPIIGGQPFGKPKVSVQGEKDLGPDKMVKF